MSILRALQKKRTEDLGDAFVSSENIVPFDRNAAAQYAA